MLNILGRLPLAGVMAKLAQRRPVFHSEADLQHAFGQVVHDLDPDVAVRLEVRQQGAEYLDLLCFLPGGRRTAIEFKYPTARWDGEDPRTGEPFHLRDHAAMDLARLGVVSDAARLERFCAADHRTDGLVIVVTNAPSLWQPSRRVTRDRAFRLHEGAELAGTLVWGTGDWPNNDRTLRGRYRATWYDYAQLPGGNGTLRWLALPIAGASEPTATAG